MTPASRSRVASGTRACRCRGSIAFRTVYEDGRGGGRARERTDRHRSGRSRPGGSHDGRRAAAGPERLPPCPPHLNPAAAAEWRRIAKALQQAGVLTELRPCRARGLLPGLGRWVEAEERLRETPTAVQDAVGLRAAVALARHRQQAARADGPLHGRARPDAGRALAGGLAGTARCVTATRPDHRSHCASRIGRFT